MTAAAVLAVLAAGARLLPRVGRHERASRQARRRRNDLVFATKFRQSGSHREHQHHPDRRRRLSRQCGGDGGGTDDRARSRSRTRFAFDADRSRCSRRGAGRSRGSARACAGSDPDRHAATRRRRAFARVRTAVVEEGHSALERVQGSARRDGVPAGARTGRSRGQPAKGRTRRGTRSRSPSKASCSKGSKWSSS